MLRSLRVYVEALEWCGNAKRKIERNVALEFVDDLWILYSDVKWNRC